MTTGENLPATGGAAGEDCQVPRADIRFPRDEEAAKIVGLIRATPAGLIVLYGRPSAGKSELMRDWVVPNLRDEQTVCYSRCAGAFPDRALTADGDQDFWEAVEHPGILVVDDLDTLLETADGPSDPASETMSDGLARLGQREADGPVVLVLNERSLGKLFRFRSLLPGLTDAAYEVESPSRSSAFETLQQEGRKWDLTYDEDVISALREDAESLDPEGDGVSAELIALIDSWMRRWAGEVRADEITLPDLLEAGRLVGILRDCVERRLRVLEEEMEVPGVEVARVGEAILREVASRPLRERASSWQGFNARQGISDDLRCRVETWLGGRGGLLHSTPGGGRQLTPRELGPVLQMDAEELRQTAEPSARKLAQGVLSWHQLNVLLPKERFHEIHRDRYDLDVDQAEAQLMARCALVHRADDTGYWLARLDREEQRVRVLLDGTEDRRSEVREASARLLGEYPGNEVRDRLVRLVLRERQRAVRAAAVSSLGNMADEQVRRTLLAKSRDELSSYRAAAVEALQVFDGDGDVIALLKDLVDRSESPLKIREAAVRALSTFSHPDAVGALVDIALHDEDEEDRTAAARALSWIRSEQQADELLVKLRESQTEIGAQPSHVGVGRWLRGAGACLSGLAAGVGNLLVHGLALACVGHPRVGVALFVAEAVALLALWTEVALLLPQVVFLGTLTAAVLLPIRPLLRKRGEQTSRPALFWDTLGVATLVAAALPLLVIHGLGHMVGGRARRGAFLFVLELLGLASITIAVEFFPAYLSILPFPEPVSGVLGSVYLVVGVLVFLGTWLYDALWLFGTWIERGTAGAKARRAEIYKRIVANPTVADRVLDELSSSDPTVAASARAVVRRFGERIPAAQLVEKLGTAGAKTSKPVIAGLRKRTSDDVYQAVEDVWPRADAALRRTLVRILAGHPSEKSLETLRPMLPELGLQARLRYRFAVWQHRVMVWPKTVLLIGLLALPVVVLSGWEFWMSHQNPARPHLRFLRSSITDQAKVVKTAEWLAEVYPEDSGDALIRLYAARPARRASFAPSLGLLAIHGSDDHSTSAIDALLEEVLASGRPMVSGSRQAALEALDHVAAKTPSQPLIERLGDMLRPDGEPWIVAGSARILTATARSDSRFAEIAAEQLRERVTSLAPLLEPPLPPSGRVMELLAALEVVGTPQAVEILRDFALTPARSQIDASLSTGATLEALAELRRSNRIQQDLWRLAVEVLENIGSPEAYGAMKRIAENAPASAIRRRAREQLELRNRIDEVDRALRNGNDERALELGRPLLEDCEGTARAELLLLLAEAGVNLARRQESAEGRVHPLSNALDDLEQAGALLGDDPQVRELLSDARVTAAEEAWRQDDLDTALAEIDKALDANRSNALAYAAKASILADRQEWQRALAVLRRGNSEISGAPWFLAMQAWVHLQLNEPARAETQALEAIRWDPTDAWAYRLLNDSFVQREQYREAVRTFEELRAKAPGVAWPIEHLVYLHHEYLSRDDPRAFEQAHDLVEELTADFPELASQPNHVTGRAEVELTTGNYADAIALSDQVLGQTEASDVTIPAAFVAYAAQLLQGDPKAASQRLAELQTRVAEVRPATAPTWSYRGTRVYLDRSPLPDPARRALLDLVDTLSRVPPELPEEVVETNRRALEELD